MGSLCLHGERDWCEKFWPGLVENDLTSLEKVVRRVAEGKGKAIPILALDCLWFVVVRAAAKTEDPTVHKPRTNVVDGRCLFVNGLDGDPCCEHY
jgi:hypothetical protein